MKRMSFLSACLTLVFTVSASMAIAQNVVDSTDPYGVRARNEAQTRADQQAEYERNKQISLNKLIRASEKKGHSKLVEGSIVVIPHCAFLCIQLRLKNGLSCQADDLLQSPVLNVICN